MNERAFFRKHDEYFVGWIKGVFVQFDHLIVTVAID